jgi:hypothetical protein
MHLTRRELRAMPLHALIDLLEVIYLEWRFSDRDSALEGSLGRYFERIAVEVDRRRRRALTGSCTCQTCMEIRLGWTPDELQE